MGVTGVLGGNIFEKLNNIRRKNQNKRADGGSVQPGKMYEVGENNRAEMLLMGGKQYMIPGNNGQVLNQKQIYNQQKTTNVTNHVSGNRNPFTRKALVNA